MIAEKLKNENNKSKGSKLYFWRDNKGIEIDLLSDTGRKVVPVEIKSGSTFHSSFLHNISYWNKLSGKQGGELIYGGDKTFDVVGKIKVRSWKHVG